MDHSLKGYLRRQRTEDLEEKLHFCLQGMNYIQYEDSIKVILEVLYERYETPKEIPENVKKAWERFLERQKKDEDASIYISPAAIREGAEASLTQWTRSDHHTLK